MNDVASLKTIGPYPQLRLGATTMNVFFPLNVYTFWLNKCCGALQTIKYTNTEKYTKGNSTHWQAVVFGQDRLSIMPAARFKMFELRAVSLDDNRWTCDSISWVSQSFF